MPRHAADLEIVDGPELVSAYDELSLWSAPFGRLLLDHVPMRRGMKVLDFLGDWVKVLEGEDVEACLTGLSKSLDDRAEQLGEIGLTVPMAYVEAERH